MTVEYVKVQEVASALNASYDSVSHVYTVYGLPIQEASFQAHTDYANTYANAMVGLDLETSDPRYAWARLIALNLACLRILVTASGGILQGAFDYRLGDLFITKAAVSMDVFRGAVQKFAEELAKAMANFSLVALGAEASEASEVPTYRGGIFNP
jgi:hypothetical protein